MATNAGASLIPTWVELALSVGALAWLWTSARARVRRSHEALAADEAWCATLVWSALAITATGLLLGIAGWLAFVPWCLAVVLAGMLLRRLRVPARAAEAGAPADADPPSAWYLVLLGGFLTGRALFSLRNPPWDLDSLAYHLPMIAHWMSSGTMGVALHDPLASATYYPGNFEILQMWPVWSAGRDTFVLWPVVFALGLMAIATRRIAIRLGARRVVAEALTLALTTAAGVAGMSKALQVDPYLGGCLATALLFGLRFRARGAPADASVMIAALGLVAGSRFTGPGFAAALVALVWLAPGAPSRRFPTAGAGLWLVVLFVGGFWMVRNAIASGNPLYPTETVIGSLRLPGALAHSLMSRTTQLAVWREGYAGQLTIQNLIKFYGYPLAVIAAGLVAWAFTSRARAGGSSDSRASEWPLIAGFALVTFVIYLFSYYSGVNWPPRDGRPAVLTVSNVRYLIPGVLALLALGALGLSRANALVWVSLAACLGLFAWHVRPYLSHVVPGIALAAILVGALKLPFPRALRSRLVPISLPVVLGLGLAWVAVHTDTIRARASELAWDDYHTRICVLPGALATRVRTLAGNRPVACVGLYTAYQLSGRTFTGRPVYAPVGITSREAEDPWRFTLDERGRADRDLWLANLAELEARYFVVATEDSLEPPIERRWCAADSARFRPIEREGNAEVYEIRPMGVP